MPSRASLGRTRTDLFVLASWAVLILIAWPVPPTLSSDQASQLMPLVQYLAGQAPSFNHVMQANPQNIAELKAYWIELWPPSTPLLAWPLMASGASLGTTIRVIGAAAVLIGSLGWARWWSVFELPRWLVIAAALLLPWRRHASNDIFRYSAEVLAFAAIPWALLAAQALLRRYEAGERVSRGAALLVGGAAGALYWVKYTAVFVAGGVLGTLLLRLWRRRDAWTRVLVPAGIGALIPVVALKGLNVIVGAGAAVITGSTNFTFAPKMFLHAISYPALMAADAGTLLEYALTNQDYGVWREPVVVVLLGVPGSLTIVWLASKAARLPEYLATVTLGATVGLLIVAWTFWDMSTYEPRHIAGGAAAIAPAVLAVAWREWPRVSRATRVWLAAAALFYAVVPWAIYGPVSVAVKIRRASGAGTTASGLYNPLVGRTDAGAALAGLRAACDVSPVVWYVPESVTALEIDQPTLISHADFESVEHLGRFRFRGSVPVCMLLPPKFEGNGKGPVIRASFTDIADWRRVQVAASAYDLWVGRPGPRADGVR